MPVYPGARTQENSPVRTALGPGRQLTIPGTGRKMPPARILTPRSGAHASCAWFPVLADWAMLLRLRTWAAEESSRPAKNSKGVIQRWHAECFRDHVLMLP